MDWTMPGDRDSKMIMGAFLQAANCSNYAASWRHPASDPGFLSARFYQEIARTLEAGKFHFGFIDDRLAMPSRYNDSVDDTVRLGIRAVKLDLVPVVMAMTLATRYLGVSATYSTTYHAPFHIARLFSTIDHLTDGRAAWNVVTSLNDSEAQNFGVDSHTEHDRRYDQADEVMEIITGLWDSWDDDAIKLDKSEGVFADPGSVHRLDYEGEWFRSRGPLTVPRAPQGYPVIMQAGQSDRGREFAARWAETVFSVFREIESGRDICGDIKGRAVKYGRSEDDVKVVTAAYAIVGETESMAREKLSYIESLAHPADTPVLLSRAAELRLRTARTRRATCRQAPERHIRLAWNGRAYARVRGGLPDVWRPAQAEQARHDLGATGVRGQPYPDRRRDGRMVQAGGV